MIERLEFAKVIAYLELACGKTLTAQTAEIYYDLLGDLPIEVLKIAAKRVVLAHPWSTFPSIAEIREAAVETIQGMVNEISPAEAWHLAYAAICRIDPEIEDSIARRLKGLPARVVEAIDAFGIPSFCYGKEPVSVKRGQFLKIYDQLAARDKRLALLPGPLKQAIAAIGKMPEMITHER